MIIVFAIANGVLYSLLLPLWEGFDEPFHYAYVQELSVEGSLPRLGRSLLSEEIWQSLELAPASFIVQNNIPGLRSYSEFFALPQTRRQEIRTSLEDIGPTKKYELSIGHGNYEAHQAPLAYALLALPDRLLSSYSLLIRIRILRIIAVILAIALTAGAAVALCAHLHMLPAYQDAALLVTFSSEMFYATTAHVCNDWLAVPLASWLMFCAIRSWTKPTRRSMFAFAAVLGLGLLSKSYFLAFIPIFCFEVVALMWKKRLRAREAAMTFCTAGLIAGPWYARNLYLYGSLSAMPEAVSGIGVTAVLRGAPSVPWGRSIGTWPAQASGQGTTSSLRFHDQRWISPSFYFS